MKKRNNKLLVLTLAGIIFVVLLGIFILNYSKDDSSFSILEKKWINDNKSNVIDISVFNDVPVYGKNGKGVIFDFLDDFTAKYGISFNKVSYMTSNNNASLKNNAFKMVDSNINLDKNDLLIYVDNYVLISKNNNEVNSIGDMTNFKIGVLSSDVGLVSSYLVDNNTISYVTKEKIIDIETAFTNGEIEYAIVPYNMNIDLIIKNDLHILYHLTDVNKKYILSVDNNTLYSIMKKYYSGFQKQQQVLSYKKNFLDEYFYDKEISEADRMGYNSMPYNVGYTTHMPFTGTDNKTVVGTLSNYLNGFEDIYDVDLNFIYYDNIESLKKDFSNGELDLIFGDFNTNGLNIDIIRTNSLFKEEYVVLSKDIFNVNSIKSLMGKEVYVIKDSYINDTITAAGVGYRAYRNTDDLLRHIKSNSVIVIDKDTYDYYKVSKFNDYNELYRGTLPYNYTFQIRDVNKNTIFANMFSYYVETVNYNDVKFNYNTSKTNYSSSTLITFILTLLGIFLVLAIISLFRRRKSKEIITSNNDKLKYIDAMTSLKNRNYLNLKMKEWDDNTIYPQGFVIVDLNNIKYINDNHGHEEGDIVIKKAASILIVNQAANTDIVRTDGNEFLIYMVGYDEQDIVAYIRKIYKELKELPYGYGASIGYSMILDNVKTVDDAINEATIDMRNKKEAMQGTNGKVS